MPPPRFSFRSGGFRPPFEQSDGAGIQGVTEPRDQPHCALPRRGWSLSITNYTFFCPLFIPLYATLALLADESAFSLDALRFRMQLKKSGPCPLSLLHPLVVVTVAYATTVQDEKAMSVLKNVNREWCLFWVLEVVGLSVVLATCSRSRSPATAKLSGKTKAQNTSARFPPAGCSSGPSSFRATQLPRRWSPCWCRAPCLGRSRRSRHACSAPLPRSGARSPRACCVGCCGPRGRHTG